MKLAYGSIIAACAAVSMSQFAVAAPYASGVSISGTTVSFTLNEAADSLTYSINGGAPVALNGSSKGTKTFTLSSPTDTFSINAVKSDTVGYTIKTGGTTATSTNGLSQPTATAGTRVISDDSSVLNRFNSPRGVSVSLNPNSANFGTAYVSNSAAGAVTAGTGTPARTLTGDGLYALKADGADGYGYGDVGQNPNAVFDTTSAASPFRATVGPSGEVFVADFSDTRGNVYKLNQNLTTATNVLAGIGGPSTPTGQNHGSVVAVYVEGSAAAGNLTMYTVDEDLTDSIVGGTATNNKNSLWRYDLGSNTAPFTGTPTRVNTTNVLISGATTDLDRGADGKFYLAQNRSVGAEAGVVVLATDGTVAYDSLTASRALLGSSTANDILRNVLGIAVSPDQKFLAAILNNSDVAVVPLINGIPDLANRVLVDTGADINSGRDIAFDAAGNIYYVSSGQGIYRVLAPGGTTSYTTAYNGSNFTFGVGAVPEPTTLAAVAGLGGLMLRRRRSR